ncbi:MAG TPA: hypothetical protein VHP83_07845 [Aggregatilineaceae bacterium]|nr:hypothetical protein [Aggregatilineaceae bacterium]
MAFWEWLLAHRAVQKEMRGQALVEYAFILIFVAVVIIALLTILGPGIRNIYQNIVDQLNGV